MNEMECCFIKKLFAIESFYYRNWYFYVSYNILGKLRHQL